MERRGVAPVEMTLVLPVLMLMMAVIIAFGFNACWKIRTEIVSRDVVWRDRHPHKGHWSANQFVRNPEFPAAREGQALADGSGRTEQAYWQVSRDRDLVAFDDDEVTKAAIIRGPLRNINVNSELLNYSRGVELGTARILRKPNILPKLGQVDFESRHSNLGDSFQFAIMLLSDWVFIGWNEPTRRIPYIYETELDYVNGLPAYLNAIAQVEAVRIPLCLTIDEEALYYEEFQHYSDRHPRVQTFTSTDRQFVLDNYVNGDRGVKLRITGGENSTAGRVHGVPYSLAAKFIAIWSSRLTKATTDSEREIYKSKIKALRQYQMSVK